MKFSPLSKIGKWSAILTLFFILLITSFLILSLLGIVAFDDGHWWDATVAIGFLLDIIAFVMGLVALKRKKDNTFFVYLSILIGAFLILFILLHSLFIPE